MPHRVCFANASPIFTASADVFACAMLDMHGDDDAAVAQRHQRHHHPARQLAVDAAAVVARPKRTRSDGVE